MTTIDSALTSEPDDPLDKRQSTGTINPVIRKRKKEIVLPAKFQKNGMRAYQGAQMRLEGADWFSVASTLGFKSARSAMKEVMEYVQTFHDVDPKEIAMAIPIEVARLDALQAAHWQAALAGDLPSGRFVLDIIKLRASMLGVSVPTTKVNQQNTIVSIGGKETDYITALVQLREAADNVVDGEVLE